ncbi:hypothetical protein KKF59_00725 [Patescibacteria group bacterium]|nr:hypothetical protein [Patescibacteria group bacterium]
MNIPPYLKLSYWFNPNPAPLMPWADRFLPILFSVFLFVGIIIRLVTLRQGLEKMTKRALIRAGNSLIVYGLFGLVLYLLTFERVTVLSARVGYLIWVALFAWSVWKIVKYVRVDIPAVEKRREERARLEKWMPKRK